MSEERLRRALVKLAKTVPEMRPHLLPLLQKTAATVAARIPRDPLLKQVFQLKMFRLLGLLEGGTGVWGRPDFWSNVALLLRKSLTTYGLSSASDLGLRIMDAVARAERMSAQGGGVAPEPDSFEGIMRDHG